MITADIVTLPKSTEGSREPEVVTEHYTTQLFGLIETHTVVTDRKTKLQDRRYRHLTEVKFLGKVVATIVTLSSDKGIYIINNEVV